MSTDWIVVVAVVLVVGYLLWQLASGDLGTRPRTAGHRRPGRGRKFFSK